MMQQKTRNMKFINKKKALVFGLLLTLTGVGVVAQNSTKKKVDGVVGVVGEYVILDSDIDKTLVELESFLKIECLHITLFKTV